MERYLRVNLLGPGPRLIKKNLPGRGLTKVEKHCTRRSGEQLTLFGRFELLVLLSATDPILSTRPLHVMPQTIFLSACMVSSLRML